MDGETNRRASAEPRRDVSSSISIGVRSGWRSRLLAYAHRLPRAHRTVSGWCGRARHAIDVGRDAAAAVSGGSAGQGHIAKLDPSFRATGSLTAIPGAPRRGCRAPSDRRARRGVSGARPSPRPAGTPGAGEVDKRPFHLERGPGMQSSRARRVKRSCRPLPSARTLPRGMSRRGNGRDRRRAR